MTRTGIVGAIAICTLAVILVLGTQVLGMNDSATPYITSVLGFFGLTVAQLVTTSKTEKTDQKITELSKDLRNGTFERLLRESIHKIAKDDTTALEIVQNDETRKEDSTP